MHSADRGVLAGPDGDETLDGHAEAPTTSEARAPAWRAGDAGGDQLSAVLARLAAATELAEAADAVVGCAPALGDIVQVYLLDPLIRRQDAPSLAVGAPLILRAVEGPAGSRHGFRAGHPLGAGSLLRLAMESQKVVHRPGLERREMRQLLADLGHPAGGPVPPGGGVLAVPVIAGGATVGVLAVLRSPFRTSFDGLDIRTADQLAAVTGLRLEALRQSMRRRVVAAALRPSTRPARAATMTGVEVAYDCRSADREDDIGGDWVDAIALAGGRTAFTVGDVMGRGAAAAGVMNRLRSAIAALAPLHLDPAQVLGQLDDLAEQHLAACPGQITWMATCLYAVYDPVTRQCAIASAGHPPPVLAGPGRRARLVEIVPGTPIGVGTQGRRTARFAVPDGCQLAFYTDGLIEVPGEDIDLGLARLCRKAATRTRRSPAQMCRELMDEVAPRADRDDVALMIARFHGVPADRVASWTFTADRAMVTHAGRLAGGLLQRWGLAALAADVLPLVEELVINVVRHSAGPVTLRLIRGECLMCEVFDTTGHLPTVHAATSAAATHEPGAGLRLLSSRSRRWGVYRTATGKAVWFEYPLTR